MSEVEPSMEMHEESGGEFVAYEDYAALQHKLDAVLAENVVLKAAIPNLKDVDYENDNMDDVSLAEEIGFNDAVTLMNRWKGETPYTDAILNEVRAEGVEMFVKDYAYKLRTAGGGDGYHSEPYHDMADHIESKCEIYNSKLRTGSTEGAIYD